MKSWTRKITKKHLGFIFGALVLFIAVFLLAGAMKTKAGLNKSGAGWLWGGSEEISDGVINGNETGLGWISFNSVNCDSDNNNFVDEVCGGSNNATSPLIDYGVNIPLDNRTLNSDNLNNNSASYAWSENLGWISFNPDDVAGCPDSAPENCPARRQGNILDGWARILSIKNAGMNAGGWEGWIRLKGMAQDGSPYGVSIDQGNLRLLGYAWSDELGWIDFSRAIILGWAKELAISLSANPNSCLGCNSLSGVVLTAVRLAPPSNTNGSMSYEFDCIYDGANFSADYNGSNDSFACPAYPGPAPKNYLAAARATQGGTVSPVVSTPIMLSLQCGNSVVEAGETCDDGPANGICPARCGTSCQLNNCSGKIIEGGSL